MRTFAIYNRKGGVGKTTTATNLAYILAEACKKRVLLIDADSQGNTSSISCQKSGGLAELLRNGPSSDLIVKTDIPGLDLLPAGSGLYDIDLECMIGKRRADFWILSRFRTLLEEDNEYDIAVIDCPPYPSLSCLNAITAADRLIVPTDSDAYSVTGIADLVEQIDSIRKAVPTVSVSGVLITRWGKTSAVDHDARKYLREDAPIHVFQTVIRRSDEKVKESTWVGQPVQEWSPWCYTARDYREWVAELLQREGIQYE
ncbi:MAG: ParA family protein [Oscillospiraceae bacterium]|nr:ParA family protein [Oscillospiraceae bacterium]